MGGSYFLFLFPTLSLARVNEFSSSHICFFVLLRIYVYILFSRPTFALNFFGYSRQLLCIFSEAKYPISNIWCISILWLVGATTISCSIPYSPGYWRITTVKRSTWTTLRHSEISVSRWEHRVPTDCYSLRKGKVSTESMKRHFFSTNLSKICKINQMYLIIFWFSFFFLQTWSDTKNGTIRTEKHRLITMERIIPRQWLSALIWSAWSHSPSIFSDYRFVLDLNLSNLLDINYL